MIEENWRVILCLLGDLVGSRMSRSHLMDEFHVVVQGCHCRNMLAKNVSICVINVKNYNHLKRNVCIGLISHIKLQK